MIWHDKGIDWRSLLIRISSLRVLDYRRLQLMYLLIPTASISWWKSTVVGTYVQKPFYGKALVWGRATVGKSRYITAVCLRRFKEEPSVCWSRWCRGGHAPEPGELAAVFSTVMFNLEVLFQFYFEATTKHQPLAVLLIALCALKIQPSGEVLKKISINRAGGLFVEGGAAPCWPLTFTYSLPELHKEQLPAIRTHLCPEPADGQRRTPPRMDSWRCRCTPPGPPAGWSGFGASRSVRSGGGLREPGVWARDGIVELLLANDSFLSWVTDCCIWMGDAGKGHVTWVWLQYSLKVCLNVTL